jgi:molecular chaperone DnaK (HSP70)
MKHRVVGIDLGTTYSVVAAFDPDTEQAEIIPNRDEGNEATTPSVVAYDPRSNKVSVGRSAKRRMPIDPRNVVIEIKREMGTVFDERTARKYWTPEASLPGAPQFEPGQPLWVRFADQWLRPQELSAFVLMRMKEIAEAELGEQVLDAVITVPAYFHENQRAATKEAALLAGLHPLQLIAEPTAAAICYGLDRFDDRRRAYLVYDLGGGTFDVSIIQVEGEHVIVVATAGDSRLGGGDFDDAITEWAIAELDSQHGLRVGDDPRARALIKYHAEQAKVRVSTYKDTSLSLPELRPQEPPVLELTRERFEELIRLELNRTLRSVDDAIGQAVAKGLGRDDLDAVLLVGGSTKIPAVKRKLAGYFGRGEEFVKLDLDPAAVVARGAAIMASRFVPSSPPFDLTAAAETGELARVVDGEVVAVQPITEHSLSAGVVGNRVVRLIERGTAIPASRTDPNFTNEGPSDTLMLPIYQGESEYQPENTRIGTVILDKVEPRPKGFHRFSVTYTLDENGLLSVEVRNLNKEQRWGASFEHESLVNGESQLQARYGALRQLYAPASAYVPPPPNSPPEDGDGRVATTTAPAAGAPPPAEPAEVAAAVGLAPSPDEDASRADDTVGADRSAGRHDPPTLDPEAVPAELSFLVRRVRRQLDRSPDEQALRDLFDRFVEGVNAGLPDDDLFELGEILDDELHRTRQRDR